MKWTTFAAAAVGLALTACAQDSMRGTTAGGAPAAPRAGTMAMQPMTARTFAQMATSSGMFEVQSSQLAMSRAQSNDVRWFAQRMVQDHQQANQELMSLAAANNIQIQQRMAERHQRMMDELNTAPPGPDFDQRYMRIQALAHEEAVSLFSSYAQNGENADLRAFASRTLPILQQHQQMVRTVAGGGGRPS